MDRQLTTAELRQGKPSKTEYPLLAKQPIRVLLDNIQSGYNVGAVLRVAEALLLEAVYLCGDMPQITGKRTRKVAQGAGKWIRTKRCFSTFERGLALKKLGFQLVAVELTEQSQDYRTVEYRSPTAFVFGNESNGVSENVLSIADLAVHLPIEGMANSINVSSAASVILYDAVRQIQPTANLDTFLKNKNQFVRPELQNNNRIDPCGFSNLHTEHEYLQKTAREACIREQCGGCSFFAVFNSDWGLCCYEESKHFLETVYEHFGCKCHVNERWGPHSFMEDNGLFLDSGELIGMLVTTEQILTAIHPAYPDPDSKSFHLTLRHFLRNFKKRAQKHKWNPYFNNIMSTWKA